MGFFSWNCVVCGHPLLSRPNDEKNRWMTEGVAILNNGQKVEGSYDGYGRLDSEYGTSNLADSVKWVGHTPEGEPKCYHKHCYEMAKEQGDPVDTYDKGSDSARCQGWFYDPPRHYFAALTWEEAKIHYERRGVESAGAFCQAVKKSV